MGKSRPKGLGSSDAAAAVGKDPYRTEFQLWMEKVGIADGTPKPEYVLWGQLFEPIIRLEVERRLDEVIGTSEWPGVRFEHPEHGFAFAHLDGLFDDGRRGLEIKSVGPRVAWKWGRPGTDAIPVEYWLQVQHAMDTAGLDAMVVAALFTGPRELRFYAVERDRDAVRGMFYREREFWMRVEQNDPPPPSSPAEVQRGYHADPKGKEVVADNEMHGLAARLAVLDVARKAAEAEYKRSAAEFALRMGDATKARGDGWSVTWTKDNEREETDWQAVAERLAFRVRLEASLETAPESLKAIAAEIDSIEAEHTTVTRVSRRFLPRWGSLAGNLLPAPPEEGDETE